MVGITVEQQRWVWIRSCCGRYNQQNGAK